MDFISEKEKTNRLFTRSANISIQASRTANGCQTGMSTSFPSIPLQWMARSGGVRPLRRVTASGSAREQRRSAKFRKNR